MRRRRGNVDVANLKRVAGAAAAVTVALQSATAALAISKNRRDYADGVWGPGLVAIAVTSAALGTGDRRRRWSIAAVTTLWGARLTNLMLGRLRSKDEEDPRYTEFLEDAGTGTVLAKVFGTQALAQLLVTAPLQLAAASELPRAKRRWLFPAGIALMVAGGITEAVGDHQKDQYMKRDRDERPDVLDTGLWGWSRHPNYFGDSVVWDGSWLAAAASAPGGWTLPAPIAMSYFLIFATGAKRTEKRMQDRPGYRDYQKRVSFFFPTPPKKST